MADSKKYYWLKLKRDFFKRHDIRIIEEMPNGKDYILFYLKLLLESIDHDGTLRFSDAIPYNEQMLSVVTNTNIDIVRSAMKIFTELNMMEVLTDGTFYMAEVNKMIGSAVDNDNANRQRRFREKKKQPLLQNITESVTKNNERKSIEKELEKEKDKENRERYSFIHSTETKNEKTDEQSMCVEDKEEAKREFIGGKLGQGVVLMSDDQFDDLCDKLSCDELNYYFGIIVDCEKKGKNFTKKTHYQAILDMVAKDRRVK